MIDGIQQLLHKHPSLLLDKIGEWSALYHNQPISTTTLHDNLQDLSLTCKCLKQAATKCNNALACKVDSGFCLFILILIHWLVPLLLAAKRNNVDIELGKFTSHMMPSFHSICVMFVSTRCRFGLIKWTHLWFPEGQNPT